RNLPLLFQILFWYLAVLGTLPLPRNSIGIGLQPLFTRIAEATRWLGLEAIAQWWQRLANWIGPPEIYVNNRGVLMPQPLFEAGSEFVIAAFVLAVVMAIALRIWARRRLDLTGKPFPLGWTNLALILGLPALALLALGVPIGLDKPQLQGFNFV